jgi:hypothetical protein
MHFQNNWGHCQSSNSRQLPSFQAPNMIHAQFVTTAEIRSRFSQGMSAFRPITDAALAQGDIHAQ